MSTSGRPTDSHEDVAAKERDARFTTGIYNGSDVDWLKDSQEGLRDLVEHTVEHFGARMPGYWKDWARRVLEDA